jgi:hypothetical protein
LFKTLLIYCDYGRLGNRLHTHANALAWCIENNYNLINLSFSEYAGLFKNSPKHNSGNLHQNENFIFKSLSSRLFRNFLRRLLLSSKWLERLEWIINQIRPSNNEALLESDLSRQIKPNKINLIRHWDISSSNAIKFQHHKIRNYLSPNKKFVVSAEKIIADLRSKYDCIVGVHARRGDYATYLDGIHYHSWETYLNWAKETKQVLHLSGKKNVGFIICSDEEPECSIFENQTFHFTSSKEIMVDIHLLSLCDYNLGPPSSFGTWISWYGKVPRLVVNHQTKITSLDQFEISSDC